jgi:hypothetical protein
MTESLYMTQKSLCAAKVWRYAALLQKGVAMPPIAVYEGMIVDGHHRAMASYLSGVPIDTIEHRKPFFGFPYCQIKDYKMGK